MDYQGRLVRMRMKMLTLNVHALLIENPIDIFYLTGLILSAGQLLVSEHKATIILDGRYYEKGCQQILYSVILKEPDVLKQWVEELSLSSLGFDADFMTYQAYVNLKSSLKQNKACPELIPLNGPIQKIRMIKDQDEIVWMRQSAGLNMEGYQFILESLREGVTEKELALEVELFWRKKGAEKLAFDPIIAFGKNGAYPHYRAGITQLEKGMSILIDIGVVLNHYASDMTRVVFYGEPSSKIVEIYSIVEEAKKRAQCACRPGIKVGELDRIARDYITERGYGTYFTHSLGHGIGLETHEPPILRSEGSSAETVLEPGMVITIEPGIYLPQMGGVRVEDTLLLTSSSYEILTQEIK